MTIIFFLIILSVLVGGGFLFAFFWATRQGQFDDLSSPQYRILFDDGTLLPLGGEGMNTVVLKDEQKDEHHHVKGEKHECASTCKNRISGKCKCPTDKEIHQETAE
jgi:cbb3-type cytochrome oxidase maturation protein